MRLARPDTLVDLGGEFAEYNLCQSLCRLCKHYLIWIVICEVGIKCSV